MPNVLANILNTRHDFLRFPNGPLQDYQMDLINFYDVYLCILIFFITFKDIKEISSFYKNFNAQI